VLHSSLDAPGGADQVVPLDSSARLSLVCRGGPTPTTCPRGFGLFAPIHASRVAGLAGWRRSAHRERARGSHPAAPRRLRMPLRDTGQAHRCVGGCVGSTRITWHEVAAMNRRARVPGFAMKRRAPHHASRQGPQPVSRDRYPSAIHAVTRCVRGGAFGCMAGPAAGAAPVGSGRPLSCAMSEETKTLCRGTNGGVNVTDEGPAS